MKFKSLLASAAIAMLIAPTAFASFEPQAPSEFFSNKTSISLDAALTGTLKAKVAPLIEQYVLGSDELSSMSEKEVKKIHALFDPILAGERAYLAVELPADLNNETPTVVFSIKMSDAQWADFIADDTASLYADYTLYTDEMSNLAMTRIGQFTVIAQDVDHLKPTIDRANAAGVGSLSQVSAYNAITGSFLENRIFGMAVDYSTFGNLVKDLPTETIPGTSLQSDTVLKNIFNFIQWEGLSIAETKTGYAFSAKVTTNGNLLTQWGMNLAPNPNFTPRLMESKPSAAPILYIGGTNLKNSVAWEKKMISKLFGMPEGEVLDLYTQLLAADSVQDVIGVNLDEIANVVTQEYGIAVQENTTSAIPYITVMADVSNNRAEAINLIKKMTTGLPKRISDTFGNSGALSVNDAGTTANIVIAIKKPDTALLGQYITLTLGVSDDNKLIISNYPDVLNASSRKGFANDADFAAYPQAKSNIQSLAYFNARRTWSWLDGMYARMANSGSSDFPSLENLQEYYKALSVIYGFKDIIISSSASNTEAQVNAWTTIDDQKHASFEQYITTLKKADQDDDGVSDYEELFLYNTSIIDSDCDNDGLSDNDAISDGFDPCSHQKPVFNDIGAGRVQPGNTSSQPYYLDEIVSLKQAGVVSGYPDGTFGPGKNITRAEFLAMIMKGFPRSSFSFGGFHDTPFADVTGDEWFATQVADAYTAGIVAGSYDKKGNLMFRPADPITRAEALMILSKASAVLKGSSSDSECSASPFSDVPTDAWFCGAVTVGKKNRITTGKAAGKFVPNDKLTRGEAAVMIRRTMELDVQNFDTHSADVSPLDSLFNF